VKYRGYREDMMPDIMPFLFIGFNDLGRIYMIFSYGMGIMQLSVGSFS
jgi:hypothetical protein